MGFVNGLYQGDPVCGPNLTAEPALHRRLGWGLSKVCRGLYLPRKDVVVSSSMGRTALFCWTMKSISCLAFVLQKRMASRPNFFTNSPKMFVSKTDPRIVCWKFLNQSSDCRPLS